MKPSTEIVVSKKKRGPKPTGHRQQIQVRMDADILVALDAFIAEQTEELKRPEAVRRILKDFLIGHGVL